LKQNKNLEPVDTSTDKRANRLPLRTETREKARGGGKAVSATGEKNEEDQ